MSLATGQVLQDRYRIDALLGQGGMGAVYRGTDQRFDAPVAIKENRLATPASQKQFVREARLLHRLRHPNLPRVSDHFVVSGQGQYLVMDYIDGEDLKQVLGQSGPLPEAQALDWMAQVLDALAYLHSQDIIHRDVKPANIKVSSQGQVFLVDFGLAKVYDPEQMTTIGARGVTPGYAPPEQYGQGRTDARTDVYSAAASLYALLTGSAPPDALELVTGQAPLIRPRQLNPRLSPHVEAAILQAMHARPDDRFQSAAELRVALSTRRQAPAVEAAVVVEPETEVPEEVQEGTPAAVKSQSAPAVKAPAVQAAQRPFEPEMVLVPAGPFLMGTGDDQARDMLERFDWASSFKPLLGRPFKMERPQHEVDLPAFEIGRYPVTNAQYAAYVRATGREAPTHWPEGQVPEWLVDHPVTMVSWDEAQVYVSWLGEQTGWDYRLPTEAEWEKAARGSDGRLWPWGNHWDPTLVHWAPEGATTTMPVDHYSPGSDSPHGCADMAGNVAEWTAGHYWRYPYRPDGSYEKPAKLSIRVVRGGYWLSDNPGDLRCTARVGANTDRPFLAIGLRVVRETG